MEPLSCLCILRRNSHFWRENNISLVTHGHPIYPICVFVFSILQSKIMKQKPSTKNSSEERVLRKSSPKLLTLGQLEENIWRIYCERFNSGELEKLIRATHINPCIFWNCRYMYCNCNKKDAHNSWKQNYFLRASKGMDETIVLRERNHCAFFFHPFVAVVSFWCNRLRLLRKGESPILFLRIFTCISW